MSAAGLIEIEGSTITVTCEPHVAIRLRRLFGGARRGAAGVFTLSATPAIARDLEWFRQRHPLELAPGSAERFAELVAAEVRYQAAIAETEAPDYALREFALRLPARDYQRVAADLALRTGRLLIADDIGVGKTVSAICALTAPGALPAVVVTLAHLPRQWAREINRFAPDLRVHRLRGGAPYRFEDVKFEIASPTSS
jgi:SNF2 family DNA or RNA helicase